MNTFTELVTLNCCRLAVAYGYPDDLQTHWRFGDGQGDGVCYSGRITPPEISRLIEGMMARGRLDARTARVLRRLANAGRLDITLRYTGRYTHSGCTDIIIDDVPGYALGLQERFEVALREDFNSLCDDAEAEGYGLLDARWPSPYHPGGDSQVPLFCRRTAHLTVQADIAGYDEAESLFIDDDLAYGSLILPALQQDMRFPQVKLSVTVTETGETLSSRYCDLFFRAGQPLREVFSGIREDLKALFAGARHAMTARRKTDHEIRLSALPGE
ncbi:hypothetical protein K9258_002920 [Salmonella enterica subsp. enterica serovar Chester]|nr:hypothetical protein [Salmonella enterica subsp. enterica serovar Chester]MJZ42523.1 hypothetical protein [Salmonella enterica subsp. enterica serovar Hvittingfoss]